MARAPSNPPADGGEGFLSRWSRRKVEERGATGADRGPDSVAAADADATVQVPDAAAPPATSPDVIAISEKTLADTLPSIDSLTAESDYRVFLRPGVPAGVQRDALRKLWSTVPALAPIEIAEAHMGDFNDVPTFPEGLKDTIYDAVRGFVDRATEPPSDAASEVDVVSAGAEPPAVESPIGEAASEPAPGQEAGDDSKRA